MPRVPEYQTHTEVPGSAPFEQASGAHFAQEAQIVQKGAGEIEAAGLLAQRHLQYIEHEKEQERQKDKALQYKYQYVQDLNRIEDGLQNGSKDPITGVVTPPATSEEYTGRWFEESRKAKENILKALPDDPGTAAVLGRNIDQMLMARAEHTYRHSNNLFHQEQISADAISFNESIALASRAKTLEERNDLMDSYKMRLQMRNSLPDDFKTKRALEYDKAAKASFMATMLDDDPVKFEAMERKGKFNDVDPTTRNVIMSRNNTRINAIETHNKKISDMNVDIGKERFAVDFNNRKVTDERWDLIKNGGDPYIKANEYDTLKHKYDNPSTKDADNAFLALDMRYRSRAADSFTRIQEYRQLAIELNGQVGPSKQGLQFLNQLVADERNLGTQDRVKINQDLRKVEVWHEANEPAGFGGWGKTLKDRWDRDKNAAKDRILKGEEADVVLKDLAAKKAKQDADRKAGVVIRGAPNSADINTGRGLR